MISDEEGRYRVNITYNDRAVGVVIRILPEEPKSLDELGLPPVVKDLAGQTKGLVLITGSTSQGKTTTMSGMIDEINAHAAEAHHHHRGPHRDVHANKQSIVRQREVGSDTQTFASGLRAALRQDPDVIAIGEMRDYETIKIALTAAETGVLVLSTLHVISIDKMIERLLSYAPGRGPGHMRYLLAGGAPGRHPPGTAAGHRRRQAGGLRDADRHRRRQEHHPQPRGRSMLRNIITPAAGTA